jgi:hypothetical protein
VRYKPIFGEIPPQTQEKFAFVIMPLRNANLMNIYNTVVKPIVESKNLECRISEDYPTNKELMKVIWKAICQSQVVIAELTGFNPNVMYELGISHTVGKETIMIIDENQKFPFNISHINIIHYQNTLGGYPVLRKKLSDTLDNVLKEIEKESSVSEEIEEDRDEQLEYLLHSVNVNSRREVEGLVVTLRAVDFYDDRTEVFLKIENETESEVSLYPSYCYAIREKKQFRWRLPISINDRIPAGVMEKGSLNFEPMDFKKGNVMFNINIDFKDIRIEVYVN